jgi:hypothetical protein
VVKNGLRVLVVEWNEDGQDGIKHTGATRCAFECERYLWRDPITIHGEYLCHFS